MFRNFPDFKGIKTRRSWQFGPRVWFRNFPDFKGIKTFCKCGLQDSFWFRNFPDFKGIKTNNVHIVIMPQRLETSLTSKGLRLNVRRMVFTDVFRNFPDFKGIKTINTLF